MEHLYLDGLEQNTPSNLLALLFRFSQVWMMKQKYSILTDMDIEEVGQLSSLISYTRLLRDVSQLPVHNDPVMIYSRRQNQ